MMQQRFVKIGFATIGRRVRRAISAAVFIVAAMLLATPAKSFAQTACYATWSASTVYTGGQTASYSGVNYTADYWTQGNNPSTSNGPSGSGQPWISDGACSGGTNSGGGGTSPVTSGSLYNIINPNSGMALDVSGCGGAGTNVQIWAYGVGVCNNGAGQIWQPILNSDGTYTFVNPESADALDVSYCGGAGSNVGIWTNDINVCNGGAGQKWTIQTNSNGTYTLVNPESGDALDVAGCGTTNGTNVGIWTNDINVCDGGAGQQWKFIAASSTPPPPPGHLYAPYADMGITSDENLVAIQQSAGFKAVTLAFIDSTSGCSAGWGGLGGSLPTDNTSNGTSIQSIVQSLRAAGVQVIISFGGQSGTEPAVNCTNASQLQALYQSVITRYGVTMLDFDIEGGEITNQASLTVRDQALIGLKQANPGLVLSYTLPVMPTGLIASGVNVLTTAKADGFDPDVINVMAMDYGSANDNGAQMGLDATDAASNTAAQIANAGLTSSVGITPEIGINDTNTEFFQLSDANTLLNFANSHSYISRIAIWSLACDNGGCAGQGYSSPTCSGISQSNYQFTSIFNPF